MAKPKNYRASLLIRSLPKPGMASKELCRVDLYLRLDEIGSQLIRLMERYGGELGDAKVEEGSLHFRTRVELPANYFAIIKAAN